MSTDITIAKGEQTQLARHDDVSVDTVLHRLAQIQDLMKRAMTDKVDFGQIPGTGSKPTLLKPGAEKLAVMFRMAPKYETRKTYHPDGHLTVESTCQVLSANGEFLGEASAMATTKESKWAYRKAERTCPSCGKAAIIKGKAEFGGGWLCWRKKDGCGVQFPDNDQRITSQQTGRIPNPDLADVYHTVLRIAEKRAFISAMRLVTGSSALFDEETPDINEELDHPAAPPQEQKPQQKASPPKEEQIKIIKEMIAACSNGGITNLLLNIQKKRNAYDPAEMEELFYLWTMRAIEVAEDVDRLDQLDEMKLCEFTHKHLENLLLCSQSKRQTLAATAA